MFVEDNKAGGRAPAGPTGAHNTHEGEGSTQQRTQHHLQTGTFKRSELASPGTSNRQPEVQEVQKNQTQTLVDRGPGLRFLP